VCVCGGESVRFGALILGQEFGVHVGTMCSWIYVQICLRVRGHVAMYERLWGCVYISVGVSACAHMCVCVVSACMCLGMCCGNLASSRTHSRHLQTCRSGKSFNTAFFRLFVC